MTARFNPCSEDLRRLQVGPIGPHIPSLSVRTIIEGAL